MPFVASTGGCTGTLIAPDRILTAAHCIDPRSGPNFYVRVSGNVGEPGINLTSKGVSIAPGFKLSFPFAHKRPQNATAVNDVALILLDQPIEGVTPVPIATRPPPPRSSSPVRRSGSSATATRGL